MTYLLGAEWLKMRHRWMPRILLLIMLAIVALIFWGVGTGPQRTNLFMPRGWLAAMVFAASFASFLWPILAGSWSGNEYGWGTVRMILARRPDRIQFALAALVMLLLTAAVALVAALIVGSVAGSIVAVVTGHSAFDTSGIKQDIPLLLVKSFAAAWFAIAFYVILAFAAGAVVRSAAAGIGVGIGITIAQIVVSAIFDGLGGTWRDIAAHFPNQYAQALPTRIASEVSTGRMFGISSTTPSVVESIVGLAIYCLIPLAVLLIIVRNRDVTA